MIQRIVEDCPSLLYLNLSCTLITNETLKELSRNCLNLQYLSLAYCYRLTDEGFIYLRTGKGCSNLFHLNLSGCTQMTLNGFRYVSAGCSSLKEIVINDMPTLSDSCVLALLARCRCLSAISLLDLFSLSYTLPCALGNNQLTDMSWRALCSSSPGLRRLHAAQCPRMTDASLRSMATLKHLQYLDISLCSRCVWVGQLLSQTLLSLSASAGTLRELNVSQCSYVTDISVMMIAQRYAQTLPSLLLQSTLHLCRATSLFLNFSPTCRNLLLCKSMRDLEHVDVSHCAALSDAAVRSFSFYCRGLISLRISGCSKMTDVAVQYLTCGAQYLRELDVSGCVLLTDRSIGHLERVCPPLRSITMASCCGISRVAARKLQPRVAHWEHSTDDLRSWFGHNGSQMERSVT
uniref:F-box and leucine-rich repeat protein 13 n=1 Tax=Salarias fasciatus TaxID=181472 RepID=A0A672FGG9_SALFA